MRKLAIDNFTAILPVTCNAGCGFCPEKESEKAPREDWLQNLVSNINATWHFGYDHISLSGGETTLDVRLLEATLKAIYDHTPCRRVGITTNGQFLESQGKTVRMLELLNDTPWGKMVYFINISRHAFDSDANNAIMKVNYRHNLGDIGWFRDELKHVNSFRLNMVMTENTDFDGLFATATAANGWLREHRISVAFRCDYRIKRKDEELIPEWLLQTFERHFGETIVLGGCPTCISRSSKEPRNFPYILKASHFEPTDHEVTHRELIQHMDGVLYYDWLRKRPYLASHDPLLNEIKPAIQGKLQIIPGNRGTVLDIGTLVDLYQKEGPARAFEYFETTLPLDVNGDAAVERLLRNRLVTETPELRDFCQVMRSMVKMPTVVSLGSKPPTPQMQRPQSFMSDRDGAGIAGSCGSNPTGSCGGSCG